MFANDKQFAYKRQLCSLKQSWHLAAGHPEVGVAQAGGGTPKGQNTTKRFCGILSEFPICFDRTIWTLQQTACEEIVDGAEAIILFLHSDKDIGRKSILKTKFLNWPFSCASAGLLFRQAVPLPPPRELPHLLKTQARYERLNTTQTLIHLRFVCCAENCGFVSRSTTHSFSSMLSTEQNISSETPLSSFILKIFMSCCDFPASNLTRSPEATDLCLVSRHLAPVLSAPCTFPSESRPRVPRKSWRSRQASNSPPGIIARNRHRQKNKMFSARVCHNTQWTTRDHYLRWSRHHDISRSCIQCVRQIRWFSIQWKELRFFDGRVWVLQKWKFLIQSGEKNFWTQGSHCMVTFSGILGVRAEKRNFWLCVQQYPFHVTLSAFSPTTTTEAESQFINKENRFAKQKSRQGPTRGPACRTNANFQCFNSKRFGMHSLRQNHSKMLR